MKYVTLYQRNMFLLGIVGLSCNGITGYNHIHIYDLGIFFHICLVSYDAAIYTADKKYWGPFHSRSQNFSKIAKICFLFSNINNHITIKFCICNDSKAVGACTKFYGEQVDIIKMAVIYTDSIYKVGICIGKSLVKQVPGSPYRYHRGWTTHKAVAKCLCDRLI